MIYKLDPDKLFASYTTMLNIEISDQDRAVLWESCIDKFPEMSTVIHDQYNTSVESKDQRRLDRTSGAMFLFLSIINSLSPEPIVPIELVVDENLDQEIALILDKDLEKLVPPAFPSFGYLKHLEN